MKNSRTGTCVSTGSSPITNFVVHRSRDVPHTSDVDVLAVRPPHVFEEIGGQPQDWDEYLSGNLIFGRPIERLLCEVKTGAFDEAKLFRAERLHYTLPRLGLVASQKIAEVVRWLGDDLPRFLGPVVT